MPVCALEGCKKKFKARTHNQKFCCVQHSQKASNGRRYEGGLPERQCAICGESFRPVRPNHKYHSPECRRAARRRRNNGLSEPSEVLLETRSDTELLEELQSRGYRAEKPIPTEARIKLASPKTKRYRLGIISDTHLCSKFQQISYLHEFFDIFRKESVDTVLHAGDLVHGHHDMHKGMEYEMFAFGATEQTDYAVDNFPESPAPLYIIDGNHDLSHMKAGGSYVVRDFADRRDDVEYLGSEGAHFEIGGARIYLWHGGNKAYAKSHNLQKWAEAVAPEQKPHVVLDGHLHFNCYFQHRNIECFQLPCTQGQTPFEKRKKLFPVIGALILDLWVSERGLEDIAQHWLLRRNPVPDDY